MGPPGPTNDTQNAKSRLEVFSRRMNPGFTQIATEPPRLRKDRFKGNLQPHNAAGRLRHRANFGVRCTKSMSISLDKVSGW